MKVVIDSNVLFRTLISKGEILDLFYNNDLEIYAPLMLKEEFEKHETEIIEKTKLNISEFKKLKDSLFGRIKFMNIDIYKNSLEKAKELLGKHEKDEDFVSLALSLNCKIWTYEDLIFKIGIAISTKEISKELKEIEDAKERGVNQ